MPLGLNQPVVKLVTPTLGAQSVSWTMEMPQNIRLGTLQLQLTVTKSATGIATKSIPAPSDAMSGAQVLINGTPHITRTLGQLFGRQGTSALNGKELAGTVQYFQAGIAITAAVNGITYGALPVLLGSEADIAIQGALATNTATVAVFGLPFMFSEDYRKSYAASAAMALPTAFGANGVVSGNIGGVVFQFAMQPVTGVAGTFASASIAGNVEYDNALAVTGSTVRMAKMKQLFETYTAVGDKEVAAQIKNVAGEYAQEISLLTVSDPITKVVIKQGNTLVRTMTWEDNLLSLRKCGVNVDAIPRNRFDIIFDRNDDPTNGLPMDPNKELSIVATIGAVNDPGETITVLTTIYGALEA
jgi:hypothetical protein